MAVVIPPLSSAALARAKSSPMLSGFCASAAWYSEMARVNWPRRSKACAAAMLASVLGALSHVPGGRAAVRLLLPLLAEGGTGILARLPYDIETR